MADSMNKVKSELDRFVAVLTELAPSEKFGNITVDELKTAAADGDLKDAKVEQDAAVLAASQDDRKAFYQTVQAQLNKVKNGVIGDPSFGPDSPLYGALGFVRQSERKSGLTRKKKEPR